MSARTAPPEQHRRAVDWPALHARLQEAVASSATAGQLSEAANREKLVERARRFAQPEEVAVATEDWIDLLEFEIGPERIAVETRAVATVQALKVLTPLPHTARHIRGIVDVRGNLLAVFDLGVLLRLPRHGLTQLDQLIVLQAQAGSVAVMADRILGVRKVERSLLKPAAGDYRALTILDRSVAGAGRLLVLDVDRLLSSPEVQMDQSNSGLQK